MNKETKKILVVEDEDVLAKLITSQLKKSGFVVTRKKNVADALDILQKKSFDCAWLDHYLLGDGNGLTFVHEVKKAGSPFRKLPIYVVSNTASEDKVKIYLKLGVNKFYTKSDNSLGEIIETIKSEVK